MMHVQDLTNENPEENVNATVGENVNDITPDKIEITDPNVQRMNEMTATNEQVVIDPKELLPAESIDAEQAENILTNVLKPGALDESFKRREAQILEAIEEDMLAQEGLDGDVSETTEATVDVDDESEFELDDEYIAPSPVQQPIAVVEKVDGVEAEPNKEVKTEDAATSEIPRKQRLSLEDIDKDLRALETSEEDEDPENAEYLKKLKGAIGKKIAVASNVDISNFRVSSKGVSVSAALLRTESKNIATEWPLYSSGRVINLSYFYGPEIEALNSAAQARSSVRSALTMYGIIYDHDINEKKPSNVEAWMKTVMVSDVKHLFMGVHRSSFEGSNHIPYDCTNDKCKEVFLTDSVNIFDLVKFKNDAAKTRFNAILESSTPLNGTFQTSIVPISRQYAIGFKEPSIYDATIPILSLPAEFRAKYEDVVNMIPYIDQIYTINYNKGDLEPIVYKEFPSDTMKNTKSKVLSYAKIINTLSSDEYSSIGSNIAKITESEDDITYILPTAKCPVCGEEIPERDSSSTELLFTRHRLATIANI